MTQTFRHVFHGLLLALFCASAGAQTDQTRLIKVDIEAQQLDKALNDWASQTGFSVMIPVERAAQGRMAPKVTGAYTPEQSLQLLLSASDLRYEFVDARTVAIRAPKSASSQSAQPDVSTSLLSGGEKEADQVRLAQADVPVPAEAEGTGEDTNDSHTKGIPEILIKGKRSLNVDIERTEDAPQPYIVFGREDIQRSMTGTLEEFFRTRLPANSTSVTSSQSAGGLNGNLSQIDLRGLGSSQTLILLNGRRMPSVNTSTGFRQPDINGIPLDAIERVEVLPSTASGIYGGGATGGVVNIITRQDYNGMDVALNYGSAFRGDAANARVDVSAGFNFENGKTRALLRASYANADSVLEKDRDFIARSRALVLSNTPNALATLTSPVLGFTPNIRSQNGAPLVMDNGTVLSSAFTSVPVGYAGRASDNGAALAANAGKYNVEVSDDLYGGRQDLLAVPTIKSAALNLRREFSSRVEGFIDASWIDNRSSSFIGAGAPSSATVAGSAPNNPFTNTIVVALPTPEFSFQGDSTSQTKQVMGGAIVRLGHDWTAAAEYAWSRSRFLFTQTNPVLAPSAAVNAALANGTIDVLRDVNAFPTNWSAFLLPSPNVFSGPNDTILRDATLRLSGPLYPLPGGALSLASLIERREEKALTYFSDTISGSTGIPRTTAIFDRSQTVQSYYLELNAPLVSNKNARPLMQGLQLQASVRRDNYETQAPSPATFQAPSRDSPLPALTFSRNEVSATKHTFSLLYSPVEDVALRASAGTGFLPPAINQIVLSVQPNSSRAVTDPKRGNITSVVSPITLTSGGNPGLRPEESESWSAGVIFTPRIVPGLRLSVDYTRIRKSDEIFAPSPGELLIMEELFPERVTRNALTTADQALGYTGGTITALDVSNLNRADSRLSAWDVQIDQTLRTGRFGRFNFSLAATSQTHLERRTLPTTAFLEFAGTKGFPKWRGTAGLTWDKDAWTLGWDAQYYRSYGVCSAQEAFSLPAQCAGFVRDQGSDTVPSQTYHDVFARYRFGGTTNIARDWLSGVEISAGIQNVLDEKPPVLGTINGFFIPLAPTTYYSTLGDPRLRRYSLSLRKHF